MVKVSPGAYFATVSEVQESLSAFLKGASLTDFPDAYVLVRQEAKQSIGLGEVRDLLTWWQRSPWLRDCKWLWVQDAHLLTEEAQTALLKPVEEPFWPSFIWFTGEIDDLLPALKSRLTILALEQSQPPDVSALVSRTNTLRQKHQALEALLETSNGVLILRGLLRACKNTPDAIAYLREVRYTHKSSLRNIVLEIHHQRWA